MSSKKILRNHIALVLDDSGSMSHVRTKAKDSFNSWIDKIVYEAEAQDQKTNVSLLTFGSYVKVEYSHRPVEEVKKISSFNPNQPSTSLCDGVVKAIEILDEVVQLKKYNESFLVVVVTDGLENSSKHENISKLPGLLKDKQAQDNWTFVFLVPPGQKNRLSCTYSIPADNILEWEQTEQSMNIMSQSTSCGINNYYTSRGLGFNSVQSFFVQPDLSKVSPTQLKKKLDDISSKCKQYTLEKEEVIKTFVENKTKKAYEIGSTYYQLMKPEKVQRNKEVLIVEKGKPQVWGGEDARTMIGLPINGDAKVDPYNLSKYDVFIQSTSVNRKLPRGTKVIVVNR